MKRFISLVILVGLAIFLGSQFALADNYTVLMEPWYTNTSINDFLAGVLVKLQSIVGYLSVVFIVIGGILYILSSGRENMTKAAKVCWTGALIGLAIAAAAPAILSQVKEIVFSGSLPSSPLAVPGIKDIALRALSFLLSIVGTLAIIGLVVGGIMFVTAGGNKNQIDTARKTMLYSIYGILIAGLSLTLVTEIATLITG